MRSVRAMAAAQSGRVGHAPLRSGLRGSTSRRCAIVALSLAASQSLDGAWPTRPLERVAP